MNSNEKLMILCTSIIPLHNDDYQYLTFLIKTGNACKERMLFRTIINTFKNVKGDQNTVKNHSGREIMVVFTMQK